MFAKKEVWHLVISIAILGFVFGFDDGRKNFVLSPWLINIIRVTILVAISVLLRELFVKLTARKFNANSEYGTWVVGRFWFKPHHRIEPKMPFGIMLSLLGAFISKGKFFFTAIGKHNITPNIAARTGSRRLLLDDLSESLIVLSGIFVNVILVYLGFIYDFKILSGINFFLALYNLIPFSDLDGAKIFFGSQLLWIFTLAFVVLSYLLLPVNFTLAFVVSSVLSFIVVVVYYMKYFD